jgi:hypothetical protein
MSQRWHRCMQCGDLMENLPVTAPVNGAPIVCRRCTDGNFRMDNVVPATGNKYKQATRVRRQREKPALDLEVLE